MHSDWQLIRFPCYSIQISRMTAQNPSHMLTHLIWAETKWRKRASQACQFAWGEGARPFTSSICIHIRSSQRLRLVSPPVARSPFE